MADPYDLALVVLLPLSLRAVIDDFETLDASACLELENILMYVFLSYHIINRLADSEKTCKDTIFLP